MAKKILDDEIDEAIILASMSGITPKAGFQVSKTPSLSSPKEKEKEQEPKKEEPTAVVVPTKEEGKKRKQKGDYEQVFLKQSTTTGRVGKVTYLRKEHYDKIVAILRLYNDSKLSVFGYIDNILNLHFEAYEADMNELYESKLKSPFKK